MVAPDLSNILNSYSWTPKTGVLNDIKLPFNEAHIGVFQHSNYDHEIRVYPNFWMHLSGSGKIRGEGFTTAELRDHLYKFHH